MKYVKNILLILWKMILELVIFIPQAVVGIPIVILIFYIIYYGRAFFLIVWFIVFIISIISIILIILYTIVKNIYESIRS